VREAQRRREVRADLDAAQAAEWIARVFFSIAELPSLTFDVHDRSDRGAESIRIPDLDVIFSAVHHGFLVQ